MRYPVLSVRVEGISAIDRGAVVKAACMVEIESLQSAVSRWCGQMGIKDVEAVQYGENTVAFIGLPVNGLPGLEAAHFNNAEMIGKHLLKRYEDVIARYAKGRQDNKVVQRKSEDPSVLALNRALWDLKCGAGDVRILPERLESCCLAPTDPKTLRLVNSGENIERVIAKALVRGARVTGDFDVELYPDLDHVTEVTLTLAGDIPEILHRMSIRDAQRAFSGFSLLSAKVAGRRGQVPVVEGEIEIVRM